MIFICYKKCSTCRGIQKILEEKRLHYSLREIDKEVPTAAELADWQQRSGLPLKRFLIRAAEYIGNCILKKNYRK